MESKIQEVSLGVTVNRKTLLTLISDSTIISEGRMAMKAGDILGIDIHDAIMGLKRAVGMRRLELRSPATISELDRVRLGVNGRVDPSTVGPEVRAAARAYIGMHPDDWATR